MHESGQRMSLKEFGSMREEFLLNVRPMIARCTPPTWYASVRSRAYGTLLAYMWLDPGREEWILFHPEDATDEVVELFEELQATS